MVCADTPSRKDEAGDCHYPSNSGCAKAPLMIYAASQKQDVYLPNSSLIGDKAYLDLTFQERLEAQHTTLYAAKKKPTGQELSATGKYYHPMVSRLRQPIESFFKLADRQD